MNLRVSRVAQEYSSHYVGVPSNLASKCVRTFYEAFLLQELKYYFYVVKKIHKI